MAICGKELTIDGDVCMQRKDHDPKLVPHMTSDEGAWFWKGYWSAILRDETNGSS